MNSPYLDWPAVGALWLREMRRFLRMRSRLVGTLVMPILLFLYLGMGLNRVIVGGLEGTAYDTYVLPGILAMSLLLSSTFAGISVLWDREFGFLREIMVAPVSRLSIVLGRIAGGVTTTLIQAAIITAAGVATGFRFASARLLPVGLAVLVLASIGFIALGLVFASRLRDTQGFNMVMSFVIFPLLLLSGALFPLATAPAALRLLSLLDPLTYTVDGLHACLLGRSALPLALDLGVVAAFATVTVLAGTALFQRTEGTKG